MAKYFLINTVSVNFGSGLLQKFLPGHLIDDAVVDSTKVSAAGGELWPFADALVAAAAADASAKHLQRGINEAEMESIMRSAAEASVVAAEAAATTAAGIALTAAVAAEAVLRTAADGVVTGLVTAEAASRLAGDTPQANGFFKVRFVVTSANINLAAFNPSTFTFPVATSGTVLLTAQTDPKENGPYVMGGGGGPTYVLTRHSDYALASVQDGSMVFRSYDDGTWPGVEWKSYGGAPFSGVANQITVGTDNNPIFPVSVPNFGGSALVSGTKDLASVPLLTAAQNPQGMVGVFEVFGLLPIGANLTRGPLKITSAATVGIHRTVTVSAMLADGVTINTADTSTFLYRVANG